MRSSPRRDGDVDRRRPAKHPSDPRRLRSAIREETLPDGGWAQYRGGPAEISVSVLSYFALRVAGDSAATRRTCGGRGRSILGWAASSTPTSYTRYHLAMFGQYDWNDVPAIPPEIVFLPGGGPFSVYDMSSWSRTIFVPLSILYAHKPVVSLARRTRRRRAVSATRACRARPGRRRFAAASGEAAPAPAVETGVLRRRSRCSSPTSDCRAPTGCADLASSAPAPG